ncbi:leucine-rich repeat protein [Ureaplasma zalophigenitalium]|uniref:Leucine-rich repeat protein n=1 Tax=Ureaplasma zalophigenitalium TaxID=907723 RepID=A0ABT3BQ65_9BACT|nr:leucine-rich repeat protein [Ureaplasma zalophigenitalium]MCV3754348.1 leucine-rich repeat protein [Ureaplasma zalophigenitalium]
MKKKNLWWSIAGMSLVAIATGLAAFACKNPDKKPNDENAAKQKLLQEVQTHLAQVNQKNETISDLYQEVKDKISSLNSEFNQLIPRSNVLSNVTIKTLQTFKNKVETVLKNVDADVLKISVNNLNNAKNQVQVYINELNTDVKHNNYVQIIEQLKTVLNTNSVSNSDILINEKQIKALLVALSQAKIDKEKLLITQDTKENDQTTLVTLKEQLKLKVIEITNLLNDTHAHLPILQADDINNFLKQNHNTSQEIKKAIRVAQELLQKADKNIYADKLNTIKNGLETLAKTEDLAKNHPDIYNQLSNLVSTISQPIEPNTVENWRMRYDDHKNDLNKMRELIKRQEENTEQTKQRLVQEIQILLNQTTTKKESLSDAYQLLKEKLNSLTQEFTQLVPDTKDLTKLSIDQLQTLKNKISDLLNDISMQMLKLSQENLNTAKIKVLAYVNQLSQDPNSNNYFDIITQLNDTLKTNQIPRGDVISNEKQTKILLEALAQARIQKTNKDSEVPNALIINENNVQKYINDGYIIKNDEGKFLVYQLVKPIKDVQAIKWMLPDSFSILSTAKIINLDMPNVTTITNNAFAENETLKHVNIPNVTLIDENAFNYAFNLVSINMPKVIKIGRAAFESCNQLKSINIPNAILISDYAFTRCGNLANVNIPSATEIGANAFWNCKSLISVHMPKVTSIKQEAFAECSNLSFTHATLPNEMDEPLFNQIKQGKAWSVQTNSSN